MKHKLLLLILLGSSFFLQPVLATETEPNNSSATANVLALNSVESGIIATPGDQDWWTVTTNADGKVNLTITSLYGKLTWVYLYDNDGTIQLAANYTGSSVIVSKDGLGAGTYYLKVVCYYAADTSSYTISNTLTVPAQANDVEPNGTRALAKVLPLNGSKTGHSNYYYNNVRDTMDWYKVTINADGRLRLTMSSANGVNIWAYLYDNDGVTLLGSSYTSGTAVVVNKDGLAAGTYYIRVNTYYNYESAPYTLSDSLFVPSEANDAEPNGTAAQALILPLNSSVTGHNNYYYKQLRDTADWYKVTTNADGRLRLTMSSGNGVNIWAYLYDNDGVTLLASSYTAGSAVVVNKDGLTAGEYYIKVKTYHNFEWAPYTLYDSLFVPAEANDAEPNGTPAQALTLPLNGSVSGHNNYYYNNVRDTSDWYKVSTNADGRLRLTMTSGNGSNIWAYLYDNDGVTVLASYYTAGSAVVVNKDGLAAGEYYIKVKTYYNYEWAPYTLADSLFIPEQANDVEPNDSKLQASVLPMNGSTTGHTNYYYNLQKDSEDLYQLTTNDDGMISVTIQSHNGQLVWAYLYDNDGTTLLNSQYTGSSVTINGDGLMKGTYYIKIKTYYADGWVPYTLSNTLVPYTFSTDIESNNSFAQAATIPTNGTVSGHVNFYYNGNKDVEDRWKINYTGSGAMTLNFAMEANKIDNSVKCTYVRIYKDTSAAPIYNTYFCGSPNPISLTNLGQGYYYVKINTYYTGQFIAYSLNPVFTQLKKAKITLLASDTSQICDSTNSLTFKCTLSQQPYTFQLYRYGLQFGAPRIVYANKGIKYTNLPYGYYYATAFADGATGDGFGKSNNITLLPIPVNLVTTNIVDTQARVSWTGVSCASFYRIQYRRTIDPNWIILKTIGATTTRFLKGLLPGTNYTWRVAAADSSNGIVAIGEYSIEQNFTTATSFSLSRNSIPLVENAGINEDGLSLYPNPATNAFSIQYKANKPDTKVSASIQDVNGKIVWRLNTSAKSLSYSKIDISKLPNGVYMLQILDLNMNKVVTKKLVVTK